jgi:hypothetical protein
MLTQAMSTSESWAERMGKYETIVLLGALVLAAILVVYGVDDNALVLVLLTNIFAFMAGRKIGQDE